MPGPLRSFARALLRAVARAGRLRGNAASPAALVAVLTGWSVLSVGLGRVLLPAECVRADGVAGFVAANLAQMRAVTECPTGTLGFGPHTAAVVAGGGTLLAAAVTAHLAASGLAFWLTRAARAVHQALAALAARLPRAGRVPAAAPHQPLRTWVATATQRPTLLAPLWRRGPPVLA